MKSLLAVFVLASVVITSPKSLGEIREDAQQTDERCWAIGEVFENTFQNSNQSQMLQAISKEDWRLIRFYIWEGEDLGILKDTRWYKRAQAERINAIFVSAIARNDYIAVQKMIKEGANVNVDAGIDDWMSPLIIASRCADRNVIELLLRSGADVNKVSNYPVGMSGYITNSSALIWAARRGSDELVDMLLDAHADPNIQEISVVTEADKSTHDQRAKTPLLVSRSFDITKKLLEHGANPNQTDFAGMTPLMVAADMGNLRECKLLLNSGATSDLKDEEGDTATDFARKSGHVDVASIIKNWHK